MNNFLDLTQFTLHFTTPMKGARTSFHHFHFVRSITSPATHQITAIDTNRCIITLTSICTLDTHPCTSRTEIWRWFQIDEILTTRWFVFWIIWFQLKVISKPMEENHCMSFFYLIAVKYVAFPSQMCSKHSSSKIKPEQQPEL